MIENKQLKFVEKYTKEELLKLLGRRFSFSALVVVGDGQGRVGAGKGKAVEVPEVIQKQLKMLRKYDKCALIEENYTSPIDR